MKISLNNPPFIKEIASLLAPGKEACIVGGTVRDIMLGRPTGDMDLVYSGGVKDLACRIAEKLGGTAFAMDAERDVYRIAVKGNPPAQVDISPLKGGIEEDLFARDFTINAMAIPISPHPPGPFITPPSPSYLKRGIEGELQGWGIEVLDPFGGLSDLDARLVRALGRQSFVDDPLRLLRAFRLAGQLGFDIEGETLASIRELASHIDSVSPERVKDELCIILEGDGAAGILRGMSGSGLLREVLPEAGPMSGLPQGGPHEYDLMEHSLRAMEHAEKVMLDPGRYFGARSAEASERLKDPVEGGLSMSGLIKLCAFLHDVGKPVVMKVEVGRVRFTGHDEEGARINGVIAERLKLSTRAAQALAVTAKGHMRPLHMSQQPFTRHALYRYVRDMGDDLVASLVVALGDAFATRERPGSFETDVEGVVKEVAEYYFGEYMKAKAEPLVRGQDLIGLFGLTPGPVFKRILEDIEEKRGAGLITGREAALEYIKEKFAQFLGSDM